MSVPPEAQTPEPEARQPEPGASRPGPQQGVTGAAHTRYKPIPVPKEPQRRGPSSKAIFLLVLFGVGGYGGYYGYCRYQVGDKIRNLQQQADGLRQTLLRVPRATREDIRAAAVGYAAAAGVEVDPASIVTTIEPLGPQNMSKLPSVAAAAMSMVVGAGVKTRHTWLVGFKATFFARHGVAKKLFTHERYTYLEDAQP